MSKKVDLNAPRNNTDNHKKSRMNHSFSHGLPHRNQYSDLQNNSEEIDNINTPDNNEQSQENQNEISSGSVGDKIKKSIVRTGLKSAGVPSGVASAISNSDISYELQDKVKATIKFRVINKLLVPVILIVLPIILFLMLFVTLFSDDSDSDGNIGIGGYPYYADACYKVMINGNTMDIEDYVAGVVYSEVGGFGDADETFKAFAIAARTFVIQSGRRVGDDENCYYEINSSESTQTYQSTPAGDKFHEIANETRGLIITIDGTPSSHYDASCMYTATQAASVDTTETFSEDNYYIKYGGNTIGGDHFQPIPKDIAMELGTMQYYISDEKPCKGNHGNGMSQNGAYYLEKYEGKTWKDIIDYYYGGNAKIMSIYKSSNTEGTVYKQGDPQWGSISLGGSSTNMAHSGCAVTSIAIGISYSGTEVTADPFDAGVFIRALNDDNCFAPGGYIYWTCSAISKIAPSVRYVTSTRISGSNNSKINTINSYPLDKYIILTHFRNSSHRRGHYVNFQEFVNTNEYLARDPGPGKITTQKISEIDQIVVYSY